MPVGGSGRVIIEMDPQLKQQLYQTLKSEGLTMREWFLQCVKGYLDSKVQQQSLFNDLEQSAGSVTRETGS